jgi:hypothetical protein
MTSLLVTRIAAQLERHFDGLIDMSDWETRPADQRKTAFLSRALAALCIKAMARVSPDIAAKAVTDAFHDNGIDALYFDQKSDTLFIVQSKWNADGSTPPDSKSTFAMAQGVRDLLALRLERFNDKTKEKEAVIRTALYADRLKIVLVTAHTAAQEMAPFVKRNIDELVAELNNPVPTAEAVHLGQEGIYGLITSESQPQQIKLQISLNDWGAVERPFLAYYGRVHVNEISAWWKEHGNSLFTHNLRLFYRNSEVNNALEATLSFSPENFWYFNNGITVICESISKSAVGSPSRVIGVFNCIGSSIVNGAQTVGTIGEAWPAQHPKSEEVPVWVQVRIISLEGCPPELSRKLTRAANLQNAVGNREFAAMDPVQHRLATEFALDKRKYAFKQGEDDPKGEEGCTIVEATQALACEKSIHLAVQAKRELGAMWADTMAAPYTDLFNESTTGERVWRAVRIMRAVDQELLELRRSNAPRAELVAIHLKFVILHFVWQDPDVKILRNQLLKEDDCVNKAKLATRVAFEEVAAYMERNHKDEYPASLSKNTARCEELARVLRPAKGVGKTGELFA